MDDQQPQQQLDRPPQPYGQPTQQSYETPPQVRYSGLPVPNSMPSQQQPYNPPYGNHHVPPPPSPMYNGLFPPPAPTQGNPELFLPLSYPPYSYLQPQVFQDPPFAPHKYRGWGLAALVISYIVSMSLFVPYSIASNTVEETGNHFSGGAAFFLTGLSVIGTLLFLLGLISTLVFDWKGFTTLNGLINWRRVAGGKRFWLICAFVFVFEVMQAIYLIRAIRAYYQYTQQKPTEHLRGSWQRYKSSSRKVQIILASGILILSLGYCSSMAMATHIASSLTATPLWRPGQPNTNGTPLPMAATNPTATQETQPTAAPTKAPTWTTVQTFTGNGNKKTAVFHVGNDWKIVWACDPASFDGSYNVMVDVKNSDNTDLDMAAINTICKAGNTGDFTEEHQGGDVYLDINSEGAWKVQIQELK